ncbi:LADA_0C05732g1_1 [Lachancea dasiensis]|uniref:Protein EFR3 n=1 Tax=Lachancea dasiensis TaxID=1072105 RepID=A0A1G4IZC4_9SACH|nr:LADA_0C05732g1_1 [Lachancea dasiensis]
MGLLFTPKHQKLVNQCYPSGRTTDKKPKSSETSYLLYYVNSRRTKLEKVSTFLARKSTADLNHRRIGNISVTLELMDKIVNHCKENLNVFVRDFLQIMTKVLSNNNVNNDIGVVGNAEQTFGSICRHLDGAMCNGDAEFMKSFQLFVDLYWQVATDRVRDDKLLLKGCTDISTVANLSLNPQANRLLSQAVELSLKKFQEKHSQYITESLDTAGGLPVTKRLTRTQTHALGLDDIMSNDDLSIEALRSFFNTSETDKLTLSIKALLKVLLKTPNKSLLQFICNGIPVQLRYIVILIFIRQLNTDSQQAVITLKLISSLLVSEVSIVGLSVLDVMRRVLNTQMAEGVSQEVCDQCAIVIGNLNRKTYYRDQTSDMFSEILIRLKDDRNSRFSSILRRDLQELASSTFRPSLNLETYLELTPFIDEPFKFFETVSDSVNGSFSLSKLFHVIDTLKAADDQHRFIDAALKKFRGVALLAGLRHYLNYGEGAKECYYFYHLAAANFLELTDYQSQAKLNYTNQTPFAQKDLLQYYSDGGRNKYSEKGKRIILSKETNISTTDLMSNGFSASGGKTEETHNFSNATDGATLDSSPVPYDLYRVPKLALQSDARSLKTLRHLSPKVKDLKALQSNGTPTHPPTLTTRGSQSVKSHITNITFLLSELGDDIPDSNIQDPDEEEVIGLEKSDLARSESLKLLNIASKGAKRLSIPVRLQEDGDEFKDAHEDFQITSTRGKIFTA